MDFKNIAPKWDAEGTEPSAELQENGFVAGYKPPAPYFNFLFHMYTECIKELQKFLSNADGEIGDLSTLSTTNKSTLVNALNEVLNRTANDMNVKSLIGGTKIESGTDLNTILKVGNYHCISDADAKTYQNCPIGNAFCMTVGYPTGQNAYIYQEIIHYTSGTRYYRECLASSAIWTSWVKTIDTTASLSELNGILPIEKGGTGANTVDGAVNALLVKPIIDTNNKVNANTLVKNGIYRVYFDDTAFDPATLNIPMRYGIILVNGYSSYWTQTAIDVSTGNFYHRSTSNTGSTWKEWSTVYTTRYKPTYTDVGAIPKLPQSPTTGNDLNLDDVRNVGFYRIIDTNINTPVTATVGHTLMVIPWDSNTVAQVYWTSDTTASKMFFRTRHASAGWTAWQQLYGSLTKPTPSDIGAAAASHTHGAANISSGTFMDTNVRAKAGEDYSTARLRNIYAGTSDMTAGTSALENGALYFVYE